MTDATENGVSAEAEAQAQKQNAAVVAAEGETGAATPTDKPAPGDIDLSVDSPKESEEKPEFMGESKRDMIARKRAEQREKPNEGQPEIPNETMGLPDEPEPAATPTDESSLPSQGGMVTIKVNGEEKQVPAEKALDAGIRALQKESAADQRLEAAGKKMSELTAKEQRLLEKERELEAERQRLLNNPTPSPAGDVSNDQNDVDYEEIVDDLYSGNKEKAAGALKAIGERGAAATPAVEQQIDPNEVAAIVEQRQQARETLNRFYGRYPTIKADPNLQTIVNIESHRIKQEHPDYTQEQLLMESGRVVSEKYGGKVVDDTGFAQKADRKAQTDTVTGADVVRKSQPEKEPMSRKAVVAEMKGQRR